MKEQQREQPETQLLPPKVGGRPDPRRADDKHDLRQDEIAEAQLFFEDGALRLDASFGAPQIVCVLCFNTSCHVQSPMRKVQSLISNDCGGLDIGDWALDFGLDRKWSYREQCANRCSCGGREA